MQVVAYIASHYRRDKIWLRRTRPDQRQYQVLPAQSLLAAVPTAVRCQAECLAGACGGSWLTIAVELLRMQC